MDDTTLVTPAADPAATPPATPQTAEPPAPGEPAQTPTVEDSLSLVGDDGPAAAGSKPPPPPVEPLPDDLKPWFDALRAEGSAEAVEDTVFTRGMAAALKESGIAPEKAAALTRQYAKLSREHMAQIEKSQAQDVLSTKAELRKIAVATLSKEDIGFANSALSELCKDGAGKSFYKTVQETFLGVHPTFLRICAMAGRSLRGDSLPAPGGGSGGTAPSAGDVLFG